MNNATHTAEMTDADFTAIRAFLATRPVKKLVAERKLGVTWHAGCVVVTGPAGCVTGADGRPDNGAKCTKLDAVRAIVAATARAWRR